ncbi:MAG: hypothetical protein FJY10_06410 [Bacteroidetes bacterium]|nr:hypothetical protein [Bacteroidota bacterium]
MLILIFRQYIPFTKLFRVSSPPETSFRPADSLVFAMPNTISMAFEPGKDFNAFNRLYKGITHSGFYSAKVFGKNTYSISIERNASEVGIENLKQVSLSAWVYVFPGNNEVEASLVFSANNTLGVNNLWKGISVKGKEVPRKKWFKVSGLMDLSDTRFKPDSKIQIYFWNNSATDILVDDFYVVFGEQQKSRPGDSTLVDMTRLGGYKPRFNFPPFQISLLNQLDIGNKDAFALTPDDPGSAFIPGDRVICGDFLSSPQGMDEVILLNMQQNRAWLYGYCPNQKQFIKHSLDLPEDLDVPLLSRCVIGDFDGIAGDEMVIPSEIGLLLIRCEGITGNCDKNQPGPLKLTILSSDPQAFKFTSTPEKIRLVAGDFDNRPSSELLAIDQSGTWIMLKFDKGMSSWKDLSATYSKTFGSWNRDQNDLLLVAGKFTKKNPADVLLSISRNHATKKSTYSLLAFDPTTGKLVNIFEKINRGAGLTIGLDTLHVTDQLILPRSGSALVGYFLRYDRVKRFDLKWLSFSDSTFQIHRKVDFTGYDSDHNPKYYENLLIFPGRFLEPHVSNLLTIGYNCAENKGSKTPCQAAAGYSFLPDFISIYSFPVKP